MGRKKNDGRGRLGGRAKGSPNKSNNLVRSWIQDLLMKNKTQIDRDLKMMDPYNRVKVLFSLLQYILPKQQAISIDEQKEIETAALTDWLKTAPDEAIDGIAEKVYILQMEDENEEDEEIS